MTTGDFAPKGEEVLQAEALEDLGLDAYEGNEEVVDRIVARAKNGEDFKASLHTDKMSNRDKLKEARKLLGQDPETGEKLTTNVVVEPKNEGLTARDVIALRDVHEEDVDYLLSEAKLRGKTVSELKADPYMKIILKTKSEERKTSETTQVKTSGRNYSKSNDDKVLEDFENGIAPEDPGELAKAQHNAILKRRKN